MCAAFNLDSWISLSSIHIALVRRTKKKHNHSYRIMIFRFYGKVIKLTRLANVCAPVLKFAHRYASKHIRVNKLINIVSYRFISVVMFESRKLKINTRIHMLNCSIRLYFRRYQIYIFRCNLNAVVAYTIWLIQQKANDFWQCSLPADTIFSMLSLNRWTSSLYSLDGMIFG